MRTMFYAAASILLCSTTLQAQTPLDMGDRIRINTRSFSGTYTVAHAGADSLVVLSEGTGARHAVAWTAIQRLEKQQYRTAWQGTLRGAGIGILAGGVVGAIVGFADGDDENDDGWCFMCFTAGEKAAILGVVGAGAGLLVGGAIGAAAPGKRWIQLPRPAGLEVSFTRAHALELGYRVTASF